MSPDIRPYWQHPRWTLVLLLASLSMLGPFSIDTYLPAFTGIARSIGATPLEMQQTLSAFLFGLAVMNLFHGAISDDVGRRPVVLMGTAIYSLASAGAALSHSLGMLVLMRLAQGLSAGAGAVVARAIIRDVFGSAEAPRVLSQVTIFFAVAPALAPVIGGLLLVHSGWEMIFWFLALMGLVLWLVSWRILPETLHTGARQPLRLRHMLVGYRTLGTDRSFVALAFASAMPFNGFFLYVLSAPVFLGEHLNLKPQYFWLFFWVIIAGIMSGAWLGGRMTGSIAPGRQIQQGFTCMLLVSLLNMTLNLFLPAQAIWALLPIGVFAFGWALTMPVITVIALDLAPERRGMASSLLGFAFDATSAVVAGVVAPQVMHSTVTLAIAALFTLCVGAVAWLWAQPFVIKR